MKVAPDWRVRRIEETRESRKGSSIDMDSAALLLRELVPLLPITHRHPGLLSRRPTEN